jgi:hypothetical protein
VQLSPHEAVAVVHQVCNLLTSDHRGLPPVTPLLDELFVTDGGEVGMESPQLTPERAARRSISTLVDELLPPDGIDTEKSSGSDSHLYAQLSGPARHGKVAPLFDPADEQAVLRNLFERASFELALLPDQPAEAQAPARVDKPVAVFFESASDAAFAAEVEQSAEGEEDACFFEPVIARSSPDPAVAESTALAAFAEEEAGAVDEKEEEEEEEENAPALLDTRQVSDRPAAREDVHPPAAEAFEFFEPLADLPMDAAPDRPAPIHWHPEAPPALLRAPAAVEVPPGLLRASAREAMPGDGGPLRLFLALALFTAIVGICVTLDVSGVVDVTSLLPGGTTAADPAGGAGLAPLVARLNQRRGEGDARPRGEEEAPRAERNEARVEAVAVPVSLPATDAEIETLLDRRSDEAFPFGGARLSPDARFAAFVDQRDDGPRGVYLATRDGTAERISGPERANAPSWSPDSSYLAFVKAEPGRPDVWNVWSYHLSTGEMRRLSAHQRGVVRSATWFPDGRRLSYSHGASLMIVDVATAKARRFESPIPGHELRASSVSPDGRYVAMPLERDGIWLLDVSTGRMQRIVEDSHVSDDVKWLGRDGRLAYYRLRPDGGWRTWRGAARLRPGDEESTPDGGEPLPR